MTEIDRKFITFEGVKYPLVQEATGTWRIRKRTKTHKVNIGLGTTSLSAAKVRAKEELLELKAKPKPRAVSDKTLEDLVATYHTLPKRVKKETALGNENRLRAVVRETRGVELNAIKLADFKPMFWLEYATVRQGGELDMANPRAINRGINAAIRQCCSIFKKKLRPLYAEHGIIIPGDITDVELLPEAPLKRTAAKGDELLSKWKALAGKDSALYFTVGLALHAGLRLAEIENCKRHWLFERGGLTFVDIIIREDEQYWPKRGQERQALVLDQDFAKKLQKVPTGMLIVNPKVADRAGWMRKVPQKWLRPYVGSARLPLHRLRGLNADAVAAITSDAVAAKLAGERAAAKQLGHKSTKTTKEHYLSEPG